MPVLEYGVGLWGACSVGNSIWRDIEVFWRMAAKFIIGVSVRAPNEAVLGELGWYPFSVRAGWQVASLWTRAARMNQGELLKKALVVQKQLLDRRKSCWLQRAESTVCQTAYGMSVWREWIVSPDLINPCVTIEGEVGSSKVLEIPWEDKIKVELGLYAQMKWTEAITNVRGSTAIGGNKLRTYAQFKAFEPYGFEPYLWIVRDRRKLRLLARFRMGIAPLRVETGRYAANGCRGLPYDQRICEHCCMRCVEDEKHFLVDCPKYNSLMKSFIDYIKQVNPELLLGRDNNMCICFRAMMSSTCNEVVRALADFIWDAFAIREA